MHSIEAEAEAWPTVVNAARGYCQKTGGGIVADPVASTWVTGSVLILLIPSVNAKGVVGLLRQRERGRRKERGRDGDDKKRYRCIGPHPEI